MNLLTDLKRIADVCSNVGEATLIRGFPQIAEQEHSYFAELRSGKNEVFNKAYRKAQKHYLALMEETGKEPPAKEETGHGKEVGAK